MEFGQRWTRREFTENEVDLGLLIWAMERSVRPGALGAGRTVVKREFPDQPSGKRDWWFVNEGDRLELCLRDPGFEVDLYLATSLRDMIRIRRGDFSLGEALKSGRLEAHGPQRRRRRLGEWLNLHPLTKIRSQRHDAVAEPASSPAQISGAESSSRESPP